jgi:DNA invertase Pin-like site-specific DNA recombinase
MYVHKLVAQAFVKNPMPVSNKMVFHKDGNTLNNHFSNLFWGNQKDANDKTSRLRRQLLKEQNFRGGSTISGDDALKIAKRLDDGEKASDIAKEFNVSDMSIARIRKRYSSKKNASPRYSKEVKDMVLKLLENHRPAEVAKSTGMRYETILRWKNQLKKDK